MNFKLRVDDAAHANLSKLKLDSSVLELTDSELRFQFGADFEVRAPLTSVIGAEVIPNPEPEVYLPHGISEAVDKLGRETIAAVGATDGLVAIDFAEAIQARTRPPDTDRGADTPDQQPEPVTLRRLIISPDDPDAFARAVADQARGTGSP